MNTKSVDRLRVNLAAQDGDIDRLYTVIQENPHVLEDIDSTPFVDTPLHVAASVGNLEFATEVMRLKTSFAWKLNPQGFTPIHLALEQGHDRMALHFVSINKDLVRAKGRKGHTPLHFATKKGEINLLITFLLACPNSIEDVTARSETALHIAVRCGQYEALQVLVGWLMKTFHTGAWKLERTILNWKDVEGNTILHVSSRENNLQMVQLLVKTRLDLKAKNFEGRIALEMATNEEIRSIFFGAGANSSVTDVAIYANILKSKITLMHRKIIFLIRITSDITEEQRNAHLIIAALVATATYQSVLSPPGGVYQANAVDHNANTTSLNSTAIPNATQWYTGKSVLPGYYFCYASTCNMISFLILTMIIFTVTPSGIVDNMMLLSIYFFSLSYILSSVAISPTVVVPRIFSFVFLSCLLCLMVIFTFCKFKQKIDDNRHKNLLDKLL